MFERRSSLVDRCVKTLEQNPPGVEQPRATCPHQEEYGRGHPLDSRARVDCARLDR